MTPDLYDAWLTAGNNLQPLGDWLAAHWFGVTALAAGVTFCVWAIRRHIRRGLDDYRTVNDRAAADRLASNQDRPEPGTPGHDSELLAQCNQILAADTARKED